MPRFAPGVIDNIKSRIMSGEIDRPRKRRPPSYYVCEESDHVSKNEVRKMNAKAAKRDKRKRAEAKKKEAEKKKQT